MSRQQRWINAAPALLLCVLIGLAGCGKKDWPSPQAEKDRFTWAEVNGTRQNDCLIIQAGLQGAYWNLASLRLEIETLPEPCPGCPFQPTRSVDLPMSAPNVTQDKGQLQVTYCNLEGTGFTRWRLVGHNRYRQIQDTLTGVSILE